ncbi:MAG: hypothetical protein V2B19_09715 [Pseudomonadota bacterium]
MVGRRLSSAGYIGWTLKKFHNKIKRHGIKCDKIKLEVVKEKLCLIMKGSSGGVAPCGQRFYDKSNRFPPFSLLTGDMGLASRVTGVDKNRR